MNERTTNELTNEKAERRPPAFSFVHSFVVRSFIRSLLPLILPIASPASADDWPQWLRQNLLAPTNTMADPAGRKVVWAHPAFAERCVFARNDEEVVCYSLAREPRTP